MSSNKHISITPVAKAIPFDNSTNGFIASDVQAAIEEVKSSGTATVAPSLREVTINVYPFGNISIESNLLFEPNLINDTIIFFKEEIL
jgi:hypothetical protein